MFERPTFELVRCDSEGIPVRAVASLPTQLVENCSATAELYRQIGYVEPWVGYIAVFDGDAVGGGAFVGPPVKNHVEVAYYTLPEQEGKGYASQTASALVKMARAANPSIVLTAKTLPEKNASTAILEKLGFKCVGETSDDEIGLAWLWNA